MAEENNASLQVYCIVLERDGVRNIGQRLRAIAEKEKTLKGKQVHICYFASWDGQVSKPKQHWRSSTWHLRFLDDADRVVRI